MKLAIFGKQRNMMFQKESIPLLKVIPTLPQPLAFLVALSCSVQGSFCLGSLHNTPWGGGGGGGEGALYEAS